MNNNQNANFNNMNNNMDNNNPVGADNPNVNPQGVMPNQGQGDYYNNDSYYSNDNYNNNANYSDTSYEEPEKKNGLWWKVLAGVLLLLIIIIIILKSVGSGKTADEKYKEFQDSICAAAETYVTNNAGIIDTTKAGTSTTIKLQKLSDASLIDTRLENPNYDGSLFKKGTVDKYYSMDNSVRLTVLTDGKFTCELVDNSSDITAPELRLSGDAEVTIAIGTEFEDPGYTATDDYDGDITANVSRSGNVDTSKAGSYTITYTISDGAGNVTTKTRKIIVEEYADIDITLGTILDKVTPMVKLKGSNPYCLVKGSKFVEPGATASDNVDGDITNNIAITNKVTGNLMGAFRIVYKVEDSSGNQAIAYRAVIVTTECPEETNKELVANNAPVITLIGKTAVTIQKGVEYSDLGATAYDKEDGDLTNQITTDTTGVNPNSAGIYKVTYRVTDSDGQLATAVRTVTVKENVSGNPSVRFTGTKSNISVVVGEGKDSLISAPKAVNENGVAVSVSTKIEDYTTKVDEPSIDWDTIGKYRVTYTATHGNGILKQTKSIVVTITADGVIIGGGNSITISRRDSNCDITQADLTSKGITFTTSSNDTPIVTISTTDRAACILGTYEVVVSARVSNYDAATKTITVKVVEGTDVIDVSAPSKVVVNYNSAFPNDVYNTAGKWVGGAATGVTLNFSATPKAGTSIAYFEYSKDCTTAGGQTNSNGTSTGTLNWPYEGKTSLCLRAVTTSGARGPWSDPVKLYLDITGPSVTFTHGWDDSADDWYNTPSLTLSYAAADGSGSGLDHFEYTYDDVKAKEDKDIAKIAEGTGKLTVYETTESSRPSLFVYVRAVDKVGNYGEWTANPAYANIDTVKPNDPTLTVSGNTTSVVKITAAFTDGTSVRPSGFGKLIYTIQSVDGISNYKCFTKGTTDTEINTSCVTATATELTENSKTITMPSNNTTANITSLVKVWAMDKAGNRSTGYASETVTMAPAKTPVTAITLKNGDTEIADAASCSTSTLYVKNTFKLTAIPVPADADDKVVTWSSNRPLVATIDENGNVTIRSDGTAIITAKIGDVSKTCKIESKNYSTDPGTPGDTVRECTHASLKTKDGCITRAIEACAQQSPSRVIKSGTCSAISKTTGCYFYECGNVASTGTECSGASWPTSSCAGLCDSVKQECVASSTAGCYYCKNKTVTNVTYQKTTKLCDSWNYTERLAASGTCSCTVKSTAEPISGSCTGTLKTKCTCTGSTYVKSNSCGWNLTCKCAFKDYSYGGTCNIDKSCGCKYGGSSTSNSCTTKTVNGEKISCKHWGRATTSTVTSCKSVNTYNEITTCTVKTGTGGGGR